MFDTRVDKDAIVWKVMGMRQLSVTFYCKREKCPYDGICIKTDVQENRYGIVEGKKLLVCEYLVVVSEGDCDYDVKALLQAGGDNKC